MAQVTELVTKFSFEGSTTPLTDFNKGLGQSIGLLTAGVAGLAAISGAIQGFVISVLGGKDAMVQLGRETNVSIERIQALGYAASQSGSSLQAVEGTMASLSQKIGDAALRGNEHFARLGISVRNANGEIKNADQVLTEVGARFRELGLSMNEQRSMARSLGIDSSLLQMLNLTSEEMDRLTKRQQRYGQITEEQANQIADFNDAFGDLKWGMDSIKTQIAVSLAPAVKDLIEWFQELLANNKDLIINGFKWLATATNDLLAAIKRLTPVILMGAGAFVIFKIATLGLSGALALLFSPAVLITAAIIALLFIIDDLIVAFQGGESVIADFFQSFFGIDIRPILQGIVDTFLEMIDHIVSFIHVFGDVITRVIPEAFSNAWTFVTDLTERVIERIRSMFTGLFDWISGAFSRITDVASRVAGFFGRNTDTANVQDQVRLNTPVTNNSMANNNMSIEQDVSISINTNNPVEAGQAVRDALQNQLVDAQTLARRGGF
jgi:hypothetical protein